MTTGNKVNAAIVENTTPPKMTVANRPVPPSLPQSMPGEGPPRSHTVQRGKQRETSPELPDNMLFECCRTLRALAISDATSQACTTASAETKQKPAIAPRFSVHATNKKAEHASTQSQKHNGYDEGHALPHDELALMNGS